jgi:hypothetical protein
MLFFKNMSLENRIYIRRWTLYFALLERNMVIIAWHKPFSCSWVYDIVQTRLKFIGSIEFWIFLSLIKECLQMLKPFNCIFCCEKSGEDSFPWAFVLKILRFPVYSFQYINTPPERRGQHKSEMFSWQ